MPKVISVIESEKPRGKGIPEDRCRTVMQYHTLEGELLAEKDPCSFLPGDENLTNLTSTCIPLEKDLKGVSTMVKEESRNGASIQSEANRLTEEVKERKQMLTLLDTAQKFDEYRLKEGLKTFGMKPKAATAMLKSSPVKRARKLLRKRGKR